MDEAVVDFLVFGEAESPVASASTSSSKAHDFFGKLSVDAMLVISEASLILPVLEALYSPVIADLIEPLESWDVAPDFQLCSVFRNHSSYSSIFRCKYEFPPFA